MNTLGSRDSVGVSTPSAIFVQVADRAKFDAIGLQCRHHAPRPSGETLMTKVVERDGVTVVFHHWAVRTSVDAAPVVRHGRPPYY